MAATAPDALGGVDVSMRLLRRVAAYRRIGLPKRNQTDAVRFYTRRPLIGAAVGVMEGAQLLSNRADLRMKYLAGLYASSLIGCPF